MIVPLTQYFGDRPSYTMQTRASTNVYIHVNNDEADRILIDPAYKLERFKEVNEKVYAFGEAYRIVDDQLKDFIYKKKTPYNRQQYEDWVKIEKSILRFDRIFNKVEKFDARAMSDSLNHERREKRMLDRKRERWTLNYTYFVGDLTEEEQQYRDYFESEIEEDPEDDYYESYMDDFQLAGDKHFNPALYDF